MDEPLVPHLQNIGTNSRRSPCVLIWVVFLTIIIILACFALGFIFSPQDSEFVVTKFYVPALDLIIASNSSTISFDLVIWDKIDDAEIRYHDIHVTLYYGKEPSSPVANMSIPGFNQYANFNDGTLRQMTVTTTGMPWETAKQEVISNETTTFHLKLKTRYKYSKLFGWSKNCFVDVGGDIPVNREGKMEKSRDVKLS